MKNNHGVPAKAANKIRKVMHEFKAGTLKSSSGQAVTDPKQAIAIGYSEGRAASKKKKEDTPLNTKMKGDTHMMRMKRKKQMGDSMM